MTDSTALAVKDQELLKQLSGMVRDKDLGGTDAPQIPLLKVNYDEESAHGLGNWVLGQRKDKNDNITEEGQKVRGLVILSVRNRFNLYDDKNKDNNCNSPIFDSFQDQVYGNNWKNLCGPTCSWRDKDSKPRCQCQLVVFGCAITEDNQMVDCMAYIKGASYMPLAEYMRDAVKVKGPHGYVKIPPYSFVTILDTEKGKFSGRVYYKAVFRRDSKLFNMENIQFFSKKLDEVDKLIASLNASHHKAAEGMSKAEVSKDEAPAGLAPAIDDGTIDLTPSSVTEETLPFEPDPAPAKDSGVGDDIPDFEGFEMPAEKDAPAKSEEPAAESDGEGYDIEDAIKKALAK